VLKLRGDYLAIVTLGFGEIIRVFMNNLEHPVNITNGPQGLDRIDPITCSAAASARSWIWRLQISVGHAVLLPVPAAGGDQRGHLPPARNSRIGRAWMAIREDEIAAKAMGINTRNMKLLAFGMGATFGGVAGCMFAAFQGFVSPESFSLQES
jgi:branched-chain amino acid transport system permease protein